QQTVQRAVHAQGFRQQAFRQRVRFATVVTGFVDDQAGWRFHQINNFQLGFSDGDLVAGFEDQAGEGSLLARVATGFVDGVEFNTDGAEVNVGDQAKAK